MILAFIMAFALADAWPDRCASLIAPGTKFSVEEIREGLEELAALKADLLTHFSPSTHAFVMLGRSNTILDGLLDNEPGVDVRRLPLTMNRWVRGEFVKPFLMQVLNHYVGTDKRLVFVDFASTGATFTALNYIVSETYGWSETGFAVVSQEWPKELAPQPGRRWLHLAISERLRRLFLNNVFKPFAPYESFNFYYLRDAQRKTGALPAPVANPRYRELFP